jgi:predicted transcriptional regulator of viral defense system
MKYDALVTLMSGQPFFDLAMIVQLSGERRATIQRQLYRWIEAGKLTHLRRGMYALPAPFSRTPVNPAELANHLYRPSYLSREWALSYHGLIPEMTVTYTSVTTRVPRRFENDHGIFDYRHLKRDAFVGYGVVEILGRKVLLADPEKALLDFWHLSAGSWTTDRLGEMRLQNPDLLDMDKLVRCAGEFGSPRLLKAATLVMEQLNDEGRSTGPGA